MYCTILYVHKYICIIIVFGIDIIETYCVRMVYVYLGTVCSMYGYVRGARGVRGV